MPRKLLAGLGLGALAALLVLGLVKSTELLDRFELTTYDWRMRLSADPASVNKDIVLVEINDASIREASAVFGHWPWPRLSIGLMVDFLRRAPAKVVALDIAFTERDKVAQYLFEGDAWSGYQSDSYLADALKKSGNTILLADAVYEGMAGATKDSATVSWRGSGYPADRAAKRPLVVVPFQDLTDAAAGLAHNFLTIDADGPARRMPLFIESGGKVLPSLGAAVALRALGVSPADVAADGPFLRLADRRVPLVRKAVDGADQWAVLINYRAPALVKSADASWSRPYTSYEFRHLALSEQQILTGQKPLIDPSVFKDKLVFVGLTASGLLDVFRTPLSNDENGSMPGIQLHASIADSILSRRFIQPASYPSRVAAVLMTALAIGMLAAFLPFTTSALASLAILGGYTWFSVAAFRSGSWVNLVEPLTAGGLALFFGAAYQYFVEGREKRKVARLFGRYVSRDVYSQLMNNPDQAELGGKRRDMTVLFSDIRGFTTVTERGNPEELVSQLNEYFSRMVEIVFRHHGTVDKFVGDMVMALFGAPLDDAAHADHAVQAAADMVQELGELNRAWAARGMTPLDIGIGVNSGDMIAGNIGSSSIMSYTVIGDNVNLGARLESLNKDYKTRIIISDATRVRLTRAFQTRPLGDVVVKGKSKAVQIFEVQVPSPLVDEVKAI
jgi:adenylate cyclase